MLIIDITNFTCSLPLYGLSHKKIFWSFLKNVSWKLIRLDVLYDDAVDVVGTE